MFIFILNVISIFYLGTSCNDFKLYLWAFFFFKPQIQLCRNLFLTSSGVDGDREKWKDTATLILGAVSQQNHLWLYMQWNTVCPPSFSKERVGNNPEQLRLQEKKIVWSVLKAPRQQFAAICKLITSFRPKGIHCRASFFWKMSHSEHAPSHHYTCVKCAVTGSLLHVVLQG